jgi:hypothetical protein
MSDLRNVAVLSVALTALLVGAASAGSGRTLSDGSLRVPLAAGWRGSVGRGWQGAHPVAWILLGDFRLPVGAARHEGAPAVPRSKVLLTIGDFFPAGPSAHWSVVRKLRMPHRLIRVGHCWRVRYDGRALAIKVTFGSRPTDDLVSQVETVLASIGR